MRFEKAAFHCENFRIVVLVYKSALQSIGFCSGLARTEKVSLVYEEARNMYVDLNTGLCKTTEGFFWAQK